MKETTYSEFVPLEAQRAQELETILNEAATKHEAVLINLDGRGVSGSAPVDLISPSENTIGLARYQRHY